jgi:heptose I phosphotransferase
MKEARRDTARKTWTSVPCGSLRAVHLMEPESFWQRLVQGVRRIRQRYDWIRFAGGDWASRIMAVKVTDRFHAKQGRSTGRWVLHADGRKLSVYLKRHYRLPRWRGLLALFWPDAGWSPAMQEWRNLEWAHREGLPVPEPVAAGEYVGPWCGLQSFLAIEELVGMLPLHEAIPAAALRLDPAAFRDWKKRLTLEVARIARDLHQRRVFHKDLYLCHFYIPEEKILNFTKPQGERSEPCGFNLHVIDLHRLAQHRWMSLIWQVKDLAQLLYSSEIEGVDDRDRIRFWRAYIGFQKRSFAARLLRRLILWKWRRYRNHNAKRRSL